jgi:hypothetical protein
MKKLLISLIIVGLLSGCSSLSWRVGQKKVPEPVQKSVEHKEAEKVSANFLARKVETPVEAKAVAKGLSTSLGEPKEENDDPEKVISNLRKFVAQQQADIDELNKQLGKYQGKKIEGTGVNVGGFAFGGTTILLIVLCVMFPPILTVVFYIIRNLKRTIECMVSGVQDLVEKNPGEGVEFLGAMSRRMDSSQKKIIKGVKQKVSKFRK